MPIQTLGVWVANFLRLNLDKRLEGSDCSEVVRILHNLDRKYRSDKAHQNRKELQNLVELVRQACQSSFLPLTSYVALHLLSYYKESGQFDRGLEFWDWLSKKDEAALDPVYAGAAIELLAVYGAGIDYCEDVYERTLAQQSEIGSQYYLSPGAILPNRAQTVTIKGTSSALLQGILSARLFYRKWQSSYLALDTAFILRPTQVVPRVLDLFIHERPIYEALPIFFMYCRGGNVVRKVTLTAILNSLRGLLSPDSDYSTRTQVIRAFFSVVEAYVGSAGLLDTIHLNIITSAICSVIPPQPGAPFTKTEDSEDLSSTVLDLLAKLVKVFAQRNAPPNNTTFEKIISSALLLRYPNVAIVTVQDMMAFGMVPQESTVVEILRAAAALRNPELMKTGWACIRNSNVLESGDDPNLCTWKDLAAAARNCSPESFVENQMQSLVANRTSQANLVVQTAEGNEMELFSARKFENEALNGNQVHTFEDLCADISQTLLRIDNAQPGTFRDFLHHPVDQPAIFIWPEVAEEQWQRKMYDELTLEENHTLSSPTSASPSIQPEDAISAFSDTGFRFDELRYVNWKTINNLLIQAEAWEQRVGASTDAALKEQKALPKAKLPNTTAICSPLQMQHFEAFQRDVQTEQERIMTEEKWRNRIVRLRDPSYNNRTHTNTISLT